MTDRDRNRPFTRRQVLLGAGGLVAVGATSVLVTVGLGAEGGGGTGAADASASSAASLPSGRSTHPGRMLQATAFCGIYYGSPTITLSGSSNAMNEFRLGLPIGATSWQVVDARGQRVGHGTTTKKHTSVTVCDKGVWRGGQTAVPGHYTVLTNDGEHGIVTGNVVICPPTKLHVPTKQPGLGAWLAVAPDRDLYSYRPGETHDLVSTIDDDPYFSDRVDPSRPRSIWVAPSPQAQAPTPSPTAKEWGALAAAMKAAGHAGAHYECPTNEPENGGWSTADLIAYWKSCRSAILAADPSAHVMGFDSAGLLDATSSEHLGELLAACQVDAVTDHMENSHQNLSNIVALRQLFGAIHQRFAAAGRPELDLWLTETGINGGGYGVLQPRRDARQRTVLRLVFESFGWPKEHSYDFRVFDAHGSGLTTFMVDGQNGDSTGNLRAGAYALHVLSEALHGTTCTPQHPPRTLRFGRTGGVGDNLFAGLHYRGADRDVVVLATNGMEHADVDLTVSAHGTVEVWDGMGVSSSLPVIDGRVRIPLDDLLTYVFLPTGSTVSVAQHWWSDAMDVARGRRVRSGSSDASVLTSGTFGANLQGGTVPVPATPFVTTDLPVTLTIRTRKPAKGFALFTGGPAWQTAGSSLVAFEISVDGKQVYSYSCPSAVTLPIPSPSSANSSDACLYTTYWTAPFAWLEQVEIPAGTVQLKITGASFGGQPDELGSSAPGSRSAENDKQQVHLAAWQLLA